MIQAESTIPDVYDANGNTLSDAQGRSFTWDFENRLTQVANPGFATTTFRYDPFSRRIQKSGGLGTTDYLYDGADLIESVDQNGNVSARYNQGPLFDEPLSELVGGTSSYYQADALGTVSSMGTAAGALARTYTYDSFGKLTASTGTITNPFQFTGREFDSESGLFYDRARYYDPNTGKFLSEDPARFDTGVNFYPYVRNNPVLLTDPSGNGPGVAVALAPVAAGGATLTYTEIGSGMAGPLGGLVGLNVGLLINDSIGAYDLGVAYGLWGRPKPKPQPDNKCKNNSDDNCDKIIEECKDKCWEEISRMRVLPQDKPGLLYKCTRKCANDQGCYNY